MGKPEEQDFALQAAEMQFDMIDQDYDGDVEAYLKDRRPWTHIPERRVKDGTDNTTNDNF